MVDRRIYAGYYRRYDDRMIYVVTVTKDADTNEDVIIWTPTVFSEKRTYYGSVDHLQRKFFLALVCQRRLENAGFRRKGMSFFAGQYTSVYSPNHHITCRLEARQALIYQLVLGLTGENDKYNYSKAVHVYPLFFDITCSAKNYKIAPALTIGGPVVTEPTYGRGKTA